MNYFKLYLLTKMGEKYVSGKIHNLKMNYTEYQICSYLYFHREISQDEISENLLLDKTTTSKSLKKLEEIRFIARKQNAKNRRKNIVDLTDDGIEHIKNYVNIHNKWFEEVCMALEQEEKDAFEATVMKILKCAMTKI